MKDQPEFSDNDVWTEAHEKAREEILAIASKYFDSYVFIAEALSEDMNETTLGAGWFGGKSTAIGMAQRFVHDRLHEGNG